MARLSMGWIVFLMTALMAPKAHAVSAQDLTGQWKLSTLRCSGGGAISNDIQAQVTSGQAVLTLSFGSSLLGHATYQGCEYAITTPFWVFQDVVYFTASTADKLCDQTKLNFVPQPFHVALDGTPANTLTITGMLGGENVCPASENIVLQFARQP